MKPGDVLHGFQLKYSQPLDEIKAVLHRFTYVKNGADTIWLERDDDNKSFAIAFRTVPSDDTGVFHILEHSVLNGSEKYPLREPFVELLKSSLATFLNAMTAPDMTIYPISSRNDKDFLNLIDVYMDAVLHPLSLRDPHSFCQEGWHYELESPEGELTINGVVYNEMKGVYTSSDSLVRDRLNRLLFPDSCYGKDSGGDPDHIPELTYESYIANHRRFYHPSNSYIFLDGKLDPDSVFAKLDGFLKDYDKIDPDSGISLQKSVSPGEETSLYAIGPDEDDTNKAFLGKGWVYGLYSDVQKNLAVTALNEALAGSNESPLTKALLEAGLCEDVSLERSSGGMQSYVKLILKNCDPAKKDEIWAKVDEVFAEQAKGLDRKRLASVLSRIEFLNREKDYGGLSKGLVYGLESMDSWPYGGDPAEGLCRDELFAPLRRSIDEGGFEKLLKEIYIDGKHTAKIVMLPSKTVADEKRKAEKERLKALKDSWSKEKIDQVIDDFRRLRLRQSTPDTPEQLKTLPRLSISDIPASRTPIPTQIKTVDGVNVIWQNVDAGGISYVTLHFSIDDFTKEELSRVSMLAPLLGSLETENYTVTQLDTETDENLGRMSVYAQVFSGLRTYMPVVTVSVAVLDSHKKDAVRLIDEIINRTKFEDEKYIHNLIKQDRMDTEQAVMMSGNSYATRRAGASLSSAGAVREALAGIDMLRFMQAEDKAFSSESLKWMRETAKRVFCRERLTLSLTGEMDEAWLSSLIACVAPGSRGERVVIAPKERAAEGYLIPSEIGFAGMSAKADFCSRGASLVGAQLLTFDYLWNVIRVKGGAYGTSFRANDSGTFDISSYRDPGAAQSLESFAKTGQALRDFAASDADLTQYIVSTIGNVDRLRTPRSIGPEADWMYFSKTTDEDRDREWKQVLATDKAALTQIADKIDEALKTAAVCVIGGQTALDACKDRLDRIEPIIQQ